MQAIDQAPFLTRRRWRRSLLAAAAALWLGGAAFGAWQLWRFESTPGPVGSTPARWPSNSAIAPEMRRATLLMFIHPECSCTRASLAELAQIVSSSHGQIGAKIIVVQPDPAHPLSVGNLGSRTADTEVLEDPQGVEAHRYGAMTSGYTVVYDPSGRLRFAGGITAARGHAGDNMGSRAAFGWQHDPSTVLASHAVYGCPLAEAHALTTLADNGPAS